MKYKSFLAISSLLVLAVLWATWQTGAALAEKPRPERLTEIPVEARCEKDWVGPINAAAADVYGMSEAEVVSQLHQGARLAELAENEAEKLQLQKAIMDIQSQQIDEAVANGWLNEERAEQLKLILPQASSKLVEYGGGPYWGQGFGGGKRWGVWRDDVAAYLELSSEELAGALLGGQSLGELTESEGKDVAGLVELLFAEANTKLAEVVADGRLTQAQADRISKFLEKNITKLVYSTGPCSLDLEDLSLDGLSPGQIVRQALAEKLAKHW
jgi:hypothetical protein